MPVCEVCGKPILDAKRSNRIFCSARCRKVSSRRVAAARKRAEAMTMSLEGGAMLQKLRRLLPVTAGRVEQFVEENGVGCTEAAIKLVLSAYSEALRVTV